MKAKCITPKMEAKFKAEANTVYELACVADHGTPQKMADFGTLIVDGVFVRTITTVGLTETHVAAIIDGEPVFGQSYAHEKLFYAPVI